MKKTLFRGATVVDSKRQYTADVLVEDGKISAIGEYLIAQDAQVIDAKGKYLLPGGVDAHTHMDLDVGFTRASDDFYTGTIAAACGGTTTIIDHMAFGPKGCSLTHQASVYHELAKRAVIDYGFHGVVQHVDGAVLSEMQTLRDEQGITSVKIYLTYDYKLNDADTLRVLRRAKELGMVVCAHCENDGSIGLLRAQCVQQGNTQARFHPLSRPAEAEAEAIYRFASLASIAGGTKVFVVHLSTKLGTQVVQNLCSQGATNIMAETCPQYLFLEDSRYQDDAEGLKYIMCPPLRKQTDCDALMQALLAEEIDTIGTDHCPFFFATQKQRGASDFTKCPSGAPGVELRMPLLFSYFMKNNLDLSLLVRTCCTNPAKIFGIAPRKGDMAVGADADLVLFDPAVQWTVTQEKLHENVDYTPYEGFALTGAPVLTMSRGEIVAQNGKFVGNEGQGRYLFRINGE